MAKPRYVSRHATLFNFFHRDKPGTVPVRTSTVSTLVRGTEFHVEVEETGRTTLSLIDGEVEMTNTFACRP